MLLCYLLFTQLSFWANYKVKLLMSSAKAAVNSFDECDIFEKAAQLSASSANVLNSKVYILMKNNVI